MAESAIDRMGSAERYADAPPAVEGEESSIDVVALFQLLWRGKRTIFGVSVGALAIATAVAFLVRPPSIPLPFHPAKSQQQQFHGFDGCRSTSALGAADLLGGVKNPGDVYSGILRSRSVASELVKRFDLMGVYGVKKESLAEKMLASGTAITVDTKSSIVTVEVTAKSPGLAHDLANAYMDALRETNGRLALGQSSQRRLFFGQQLTKEKDDLEDAEVELKKTEEQSV